MENHKPSAGIVMKKSNELKTLFFTSILFCLLAGCGDNVVRNQSGGQELIDLKKAYTDNAITKKEYEEQRQKILERDD
jgi:uncharacterized lipoprotein YehR (DUF1307 family)